MGSQFQGLGFAAQFCITDGAVNHGIVRTSNSAGGFYTVLFHRIALNVLMHTVVSVTQVRRTVALGAEVIVAIGFRIGISRIEAHEGTAGDGDLCVGAILQIQQELRTQALTVNTIVFAASNVDNCVVLCVDQVIIIARFCANREIAAVDGDITVLLRPDSSGAALGAARHSAGVDG